ncbi:MAG: hypothetical protein COX62_05405 [Deltaproteobacteria bacterium CG_4_10_14_0_2_um_filter_43_8]|nr:MAG: hypothetical protein COV43_06405 [Deltaproteobacteria bacterium CG11_big_fil_rev_8_21_14_0_20_42_23]PJA20023.1 MAG: hypothetical protein COX62_05405 [Deltaproteobacteria bacterium CG_4_10_14_0_2_um_filter_43_8]PJC63389.1 MAG: hypothetical protein CO021_09720 [Deltaproteobacteria bacterium CG_4_9_14_0_2_um_filter_42_21]
MKKQITLTLVMCGTFLFSTHFLLADENEKAKNAPELETASPSTLQSINLDYQKKVKPIFEAKCFDCHSKNTVYPWYYKVPGIKQLMDSDIEEGLEHMDMTNGFPFAGHHPSAQKQLEELDEVLEENDMPPLQYKLMHWNSKLTPADKAVILDWIENSTKAIKPK